jgi:hypothetical protein
MAKVKNVNSFEVLVGNIASIRNCFKKGLIALGAHAVKVEVQNTRLLCGSVNIDECLRTQYPQSNRWDYLICYDNFIYFIEVHSGHTGEVSTMLRKLQWLKDWINSDAPALKPLLAKPKAFIWILSKGNQIQKGSRQSKLLAQNGLNPISRLKL